MPGYYGLGATVDRVLEPDTKAIIAKDFALIGGGGSVPGWVSGTSATWSPPVFNRESPDLLAVREGVRRAMQGVADFEIVTPGDSKTRRGGVVNWPEQLRRMLGAVDGFVSADDGVTDSRWSRVRMSVSATRSVIGLVPAAGSAGLEKSVTYTSTDAHDGALPLVRASSGATLVVTIDGGAPSNHVIPAGAAWRQIDVGPLTNAVHTITVSTLSDTFEYAGITLTYPTPRLKISNPARSGSDASNWLPGSDRWTTVIDGLATTPGLIMSALGTNAATDLTSLETYYDGLATLNVPVIIVSPGGMGSVDRPRVSVEPMMSKLYQLAQEHDWPLIDFESVVGQYGAALSHLLMDDTLHESTRGLLLEALAVYALLVG